MNYRLRCHLVAAFVTGITVGPLTLLVADRTVPFEIYSGRIEPENPHPGDRVEIIWTGDRHRDCPGDVERKLIDAWGAPHLIAGAEAQYTKSENPQPVVRSFRLPLNLPPGKTTYIATSKFYCNFTQKWWPIVVERPRVEFTVVRPVFLPGPQGPTGPAGPIGPEGAAGKDGR